MTKTEAGRAARGRPREFDRAAALAKALKLFWEQGYMQTTMQQLCRAMGIRSPSLYCAFGSKGELFVEALAHYRKIYWTPVFQRFLNEDDLHEAAKNLFEATARILLMPEAPCGCLTVFSALTLPAGEKDILAVISRMRAETRNIFLERLTRAMREGQLPPDCGLAALAGGLTNFFEGLTLQARDQDISLDELRAIAMLGLKLLPQGE